MKARNRPHRITVERFTTTRNAYNEVIETWAPYCEAYAAVYYGTGAEQRQAAQEGASLPASFEVLANSKTREISVMDRISFNGLWDIRSVAPMGRDGIKINAVRAAS
ncbi:head-tail adaptor protein [Sphingobium sp. JS3065]|uniref:head-tail adaptor protein n=1 Tax=Sphingobium sp. JS3065 TaxID=2970925 RepID=UPI002263E4E2|nr:head-tail adaptor protein [Sphingobium sp. JS3065]UZW54963.1 head-tail adaptor protein [Sphingobium sp. JS3065]